jgi:pimeloyl-ACP methyl ester carboxylesterase
MHEAYASVAPQPEKWPTLAAKLGAMLSQDYDWSAGVAAMKAPMLIVIGDSDGVRPAHAVEMYGLRGGGKADVGMGEPPASQLAVLPGTTHFSIVLRTDLLLPVIVQFLDAPVPEAR